MSHSFFQNRDCEYFPCHTGVASEEFNCLFCYCPLYALGEDCGGDYTFSASGRKSCINCVKPHASGGFDHVKKGIKQVCALVEKGETPPGLLESEAGPRFCLFFFSRTGRQMALSLAGKLKYEGEEALITGPLSLQDGQSGETILYKDTQKAVKEAFRRGRVLVFIGAAGIAVRLIAPFVRDKAGDPAVIVMDEEGLHVIPILSGHLGGANEQARFISRLTGAESVITTATDLKGLVAPDVYAKSRGLEIGDMEQAKAGAACLLEGGEVRYEISPFIQAGYQKAEKEGDGAVHVWLVPGTVVIGAGCKKGVDPEEMVAFAKRLLSECGLSPKAVRAVASIDVKQEEPAILALAGAFRAESVFYDAKTLEGVPGDFASSDFVRDSVGVSNVCERAAACFAQGIDRSYRFVAPKTTHKGMTIAILLIEEKTSPGEES